MFLFFYFRRRETLKTFVPHSIYRVLSTLPFVFRLLNYANVGGLIYCETFRELKFTGGPLKTVRKRQRERTSEKKGNNIFDTLCAAETFSVQKISVFSVVTVTIGLYDKRYIFRLSPVFNRFEKLVGKIRETAVWNRFEIANHENRILLRYPLLGHSNWPRFYSYDQETYFYWNEYSYVIWIPKSSLRINRFREISNTDFILNIYKTKNTLFLRKRTYFFVLS